MNLKVMLKKEFRDMIKSYKIIWVPIAFVLINITNPIMMKMLPTLLKNAGNVPQGAVISVPEATTFDVLTGFFSNFSQLGIIVVALLLMGVIAGERSSGAISMVLVKPVSRGVYFFSKFIAYASLITVSFIFSSLFAAYYTNIMYGNVDFVNILKGTLVFTIYILSILAGAMCYGTFIKSQLGVAGATVATHILLTTIPQYLSSFGSDISPNKLISGVGKILNVGSAEILLPVVFIVVVMVGFLLSGYKIFQNQEV